MRKLGLIACGVVMGAATALIATQHDFFTTTAARAASTDTYRQLNLFGDVFDRVRSDYVEKPEDAQLIETAINGMLTSLDPHSAYLNPKNFRDMQVQTRGEFGGLGIEVTMENGFVKVVTTIDDTPAARGGVMGGDLITHLDGESIQGLTLNQAVEKMRGAPNTAILLKVQRQGADDPIEIKLTRDVIRIKSVKFREEGNDVGYIRISQFNEQTTDLLKAAMESFEKSMGVKLKGYVLDLRNNPGGVLDQAIQVSDTFLEKGEIVSTRGRNLDETQRYNARTGDLAKGKPVIVLINGGSASASEIVAGALQDHKRATVIGTRSFGKGSVQTIIPLGANGAIKLTTARYYTPSGRSIQAKGIDPDTVVLQDIPAELKGKDETKGEASLRGHLKGEANTERGGSSAYVPQKTEEDKQLQYALALARGQTPPVQTEAKAQEPKAANENKTDVKPAEKTEKKTEEKAVPSTPKTGTGN